MDVVHINENMEVEVGNVVGEAAQAEVAHPRYPMMGFLASGILAAIACDNPRNVRTLGFWVFDNSSKILKKIQTAVKSLNDPFATVDHVNEPEISLGFSSFKSILTMLKTNRPSAVHHWALWGVANACSAQPQRHVPMFRREGGFQLLKAIVKHDKDAEVQRLAKRLIEFTLEFEKNNVKNNC